MHAWAEVHERRCMGGSACFMRTHDEADPCDSSLTASREAWRSAGRCTARSPAGRRLWP